MSRISFFFKICSKKTIDDINYIVVIIFFLSFFVLITMYPKKISVNLSLIAFTCLHFVIAAPSPTDSRAEQVKKAFKHAWGGYASYAYGHDELQSISNEISDSRYL